MTRPGGRRRTEAARLLRAADTARHRSNGSPRSCPVSNGSVDLHVGGDVVASDSGKEALAGSGALGSTSGSFV